MRTQKFKSIEKKKLKEVQIKLLEGNADSFKWEIDILILIGIWESIF